MSAKPKVTKTKTALKQETYNLSDLKHGLHQGGDPNAALKSRAFGPRTAAEARRADSEAVAAKRLAQRFVLGVRSGGMY